MTAVAFLRAMNVGGRRITNNDLVAAFRSIGFEAPVAYQASGNVILPGASADKATATRIEAGLLAELGYEVPTFLRSQAAIEELASSTPYLDQNGPRDGKPQIIFLRTPILDPAMLESLRQPKDQWEAIGTELHWLPAAGLSQTELKFNELEKLVGPNTIRTFGTIQRLSKKLA